MKDGLEPPIHGRGWAPLKEALRLTLSGQHGQGRWKLENTLNGKMWADIEVKGQPSKWITWRALRVLQLSSRFGSEENP